MILILDSREPSSGGYGRTESVVSHSGPEPTFHLTTSQPASQPNSQPAPAVVAQGWPSSFRAMGHN